MSPRLLELPPADWPARFVEHGGKAFHGRSAASWVFRRGASRWSAMSDLPAALRARLEEEEPLCLARAEARSDAGDGAVKLLLRYPDGAAAEAVGMPGTQGRTLCISTQVGCPVRCSFCASGLDGLERNLDTGEILEQVVLLSGELGGYHRLVVMGMGDAGFNLQHTLRALDALMAKEGGGLSARRITLSTVAPRGALAQIAAWGRPVTLALSLHAPDDELRHRLVPGVAKRSLAETLGEADRLFARTGREFTVEYVLLQGVNDAPEQARQLGALLRGHRCHVNLIPYNPVTGLGFARPPLEAQEAFATLVRQAGPSVTLRRSLERAVNAAYGQLQRRTAAQPAPGSVPPDS